METEAATLPVQPVCKPSSIGLGRAPELELSRLEQHHLERREPVVAVIEFQE
ncbi:hypothetical protein [Chelativorans xinjiangense]|uniref:hypothetical protein n=1 Tax=Chelativorans xinjiangense TaxID=2681485 RepID=UPI001FE65B3F|nr:hypothetical protein [Chelativorans xinjiangense]